MPKNIAVVADAQVEHHVANIVRFHDSGNVSLSRYGDRMGYESLKKGGTSLSEQENLRKARKFAQVYSSKQVDELIASCRREVSAISISHIKLLVTVKDQATRSEL